MNLRNLAAALLLMSAGLFTMTSCTKDDDEISAVVENNITRGTWRITNFDDSGDDKTSTFSGYNFTFTRAGVVTASNGILTQAGTWSITDGDEDNNVLDDLDFNISFPQATIFGDLSDDWDIFAQSSDNLELLEAGGLTDNDFLTFKQN